MGPLDVLTQAAMETIAPLTKQLRAQGWDAQIMLRAPEIGHRVVAIEVHLRALVPIESTEQAV